MDYEMNFGNRKKKGRKTVKRTKKGTKEVFLRMKEFDNDPRVKGRAYRKARVGSSSRSYNLRQDKSKFKKVVKVNGTVIYKGPPPSKSKRAGFGCGGSCRTGFGKLSALHQGMSPYSSKFGSLHDSLSIMSPYTPSSAKFGIPLSTLDSFQSTYTPTQTTVRTADVAAKFGEALNQYPSLSTKFGAGGKSKSFMYRNPPPPTFSFKPKSHSFLYSKPKSSKPKSSKSPTFSFSPFKQRRSVKFGCGGSRSTGFGCNNTRFGGGYGKLF